MLRLISKLHDALNQFKSFDAGYTTSNNTQMIVQFDGVNYKVTLEELGAGEIIDHVRRLSK